MRRISLAGPKKPYDLVLVSAIVVLTIVLSQLRVDSPALWILALFSVYFAPGYALVSILFPGKRVMLIGSLLMKQEPKSSYVSALERIVLSFVLSIAVLAIAGIVLSRGLSDVTTTTVGLEVLIITVGASIVALYIRTRLAPEDQFSLTLTIGEERAGFTAAEKVTAVLIVGSLLIVAVVVANGLSGQGTKESYTEFYLTGPDGKLSSLPASILVGENASVMIKITNRMNHLDTYNLTIGIENGTSFDELIPLVWEGPKEVRNGTGYYTSIGLEDGEAFMHEFTFQIASSGKYKLSFFLNDGSQEKELWLRLEVGVAI
jgi:uncharacterized membrane protein